MSTLLERLQGRLLTEQRQAVELREDLKTAPKADQHLIIEELAETINEIDYFEKRIKEHKEELANSLTNDQFFEVITATHYDLIEVYCSATQPTRPLTNKITAVHMMLDDISIERWSMDKGYITMSDYGNNRQLMTLNYHDGSKTAYIINGYKKVA